MYREKQRRRPYEDRRRDWCEAATGQGVSGTKKLGETTTSVDLNPSACGHSLQQQRKLILLWDFLAGLGRGLVLPDCHFGGNEHFGGGE